MANIKNAVVIAEFRCPPEKNTLMFIFDQSSCHKAFADNALNASRMNERLEESSHVCEIQCGQEGFRSLLMTKGCDEEDSGRCGINTSTMKADEM